MAPQTNAARDVVEHATGHRLNSIKPNSTPTKPGTSTKKKRARGSGSTGRINKSPSETIAQRQCFIELITSRGRAITQRGAYYLAVSMRLGDKGDRFYKFVCKQLDIARRKGELAWEWIVDATRGPRIIRTFADVPEALHWLAEKYRLSYWHDAPELCMIWCEKRTQSGIINEETDEYAAYYNCTNGCNSSGNSHDAAELIEADGRPTHIYFFGDLDKPGLDLYEAFRRDVQQWTPTTEVHIHRVGITFEQVAKFGLLTHDVNPKHKSAWRKICKANGWPIDVVCELDAMEPEILQATVRECILNHVAMDAYNALMERQETERQDLRDFAATYGGAS